VKASPKTALPTKPKQQVALTPEDYVQLKSQLAALEEERGRIAEELRRAAADKDFRENAPLQAAREHRDQVEAQIRQLQATISTGVVVEEKPAEESAVRLRSKVTLCDIASGKKLTYTLVTKNEANPAKNKISIVSPLGKALLNQRQGNVVKVIAPAGELCYQIEQIE
jgi:transcription elongation factor GreA